jgi:hypothetical protein
MKKINTPRLTAFRVVSTVAVALVAMANARASYQSTVLNDNPIAYYPLDVSIDATGTTATDLSGNNNNGTYVGNTPQYGSVAGPTTFIPNAFQFDGQSVWVDLSTGNNTSILNFGGKITMEAWVQAAVPSQSLGDILAKGYDGNNNDNEMTLRVNGDQYQGGTYNNSAGTKGANWGPPTTSWAYVVATYDGANWNLYVNGQLENQGSDTVGALDFSDPWAIGNGTASGYGRWFQGNLAQVALYTNALTSAQVYSHYFAGEYGTSPSNSVPIITVQPTPQVSYVGGGATFGVSVLSILPTTNQWYFNNIFIAGATNATLALTNVQTAGNYSVVVGNSNGTTNSVAASLTLSLPAPSVYESKVLNDQPIAFCPLESSADTTTTAYDWSGNGNNGTYNASSSYNSGNDPAPYISNSANFNGSLSATLGGQNSGLLNFGGKITLEAWVQPSNVTGNLQDMLAKGYDSSTYNETVLRQDSGTFTSNGGSGGVAQVGTWAYVVSANDGTNWNLYVNGILVKQSVSSSGAENFSDPWAIGGGTSGGSSRYMSGNLSQVALYNYGLSPAQVAAHYLIAESGATNVRPVIATQPMSQNGFVGGNATFSVSAVSLSTTTNQWFWKGNPLNGQTNATLTLTDLSLTSAGNYSVVVGNIYGTTNSALATLTISVPNNLLWSSNNNSGVWDTGTSTNWINLATSAQTVFNAGDAVTFDDTVGVPTTVTLGVGSTVQPSLITVNSSANNFSIQRAGDGSGILSGSGSLLKKGTSTLTVTSGGGLTGTATIAGGLVSAGNNSFADMSGITITNDSTLDIAGGSFNNPVPVTISDSGFNGQGAIINSYGDYPTAAFDITLAGDATISPNPQRWDLVSGSVTGAHTLTVNGNGGYSMEWNSLTIGANVSTIIFTNGDFGMKYLDSAFQNPATVCIISSNSQFDFWNGGFNGSLYLMSGAAINIYSGEPLTIGSGATLSTISSTVNGTLVGAAGATISPSGASTGVATGVLAVSGNFTNNGTIVIKLDGSGVNDSIICSNSITYGGTLNLVNVSGSPLAIGNTFQIFSATNYSGSFAGGITPPTPGAGLAWDTTQLLSSGVINVVAARPVIGSTTVSGGNLILSGTGGTASSPYSVLTTTNLTLPLTEWTQVATGNYSATGTFTNAIVIVPGVPQSFYIIK